MKRIISLFILITISIISLYAKPPQLSVEKLFDGRYNNNKSVATTIYKTNGNYYRGLTVTNNPEIIKKISSAIDTDKHRGKDYTDFKDNTGHYTSLKVINNGQPIFIGLQRDKSGGAFFFIQGKESAFK